jgi:soluble epoxide hydrolase/lipid-phosphate phosphatase
MEEWIKERKTTKLAPWVKQTELDTHDKILKAGGYTGPLNWYKQGMAGVTHASELKISPEYESIKITTPTLFVGCEKDMVCLPAFQLARMKDFIQDLTVKSLESSHWVMIEKPKEMWEFVQGWIEEKGNTA